MFARVVAVQIQPGRMEEAIEIFRDSISSVAKQQKGNRGGYLLTDVKTCNAVSIAFWETEADMAAGESSDYLREQLTRLASTFAAPPTPEHFEVSDE